jgi:hypothetical protein
VGDSGSCPPFLWHYLQKQDIIQTFTYKSNTMKKFIFPIALLTIVFLSTASVRSVHKSDDNKSAAIVDQVNGLYVFIDSKPSAEYDYLGTVDTRKVSFPNPQYQYVRDYLLKKAKKEFPSGDAVLLHLSAGDHDKADVIKFK